VSIKSIFGTYLRAHEGGEGAYLDLNSEIGPSE
jgi:hypothetical protein